MSKCLGKHKSSGTAVSPLAGKLFVVIGAGGAGKTLAYGAKEKGARIVIANRTYDRARELADIIGGDALAPSDLDSYHPEDGMILANTTSIGMQPKVDETPISKGRGNVSVSSGAREMASILDTALLQALLLTGQSSAALELFRGVNYCDMKICEEILQTTQA